MARNLPNKQVQRRIQAALADLKEWQRGAIEAYEAEDDPEVSRQLRRDADDLEFVCYHIELLLHPNRNDP